MFPTSALMLGLHFYNSNITVHVCHTEAGYAFVYPLNLNVVTITFVESHSSSQAIWRLITDGRLVYWQINDAHTLITERWTAR